MTPRSLCLVLGLAYVGLGAMGLMPGLLTILVNIAESPPLAVVHLAMAAWALAAYAGRAPEHSFAAGAGFIFAALALAGMLHGMDRFLGDYVWLHLATAAVCGLIAWEARGGERRGIAGDRRRRSAAAVRIERRHGTYDRRKASSAA